MKGRNLLFTVYHSLYLLSEAGFFHAEAKNICSSHEASFVVTHLFVIITALATVTSSPVYINPILKKKKKEADP